MHLSYLGDREDRHEEQHRRPGAKNPHAIIDGFHKYRR